MGAQLHQGKGITLCNKCQQPVTEPVEGKDGEPYHRDCGKSLALLG